MSTAQAAFHCYTSQHPNIKRGPPYILPLLNFIWFLLKAVERSPSIQSSHSQPIQLGASWPDPVPSLLTSLLSLFYLTRFLLGFNPTYTRLLRSQGTPLGIETSGKLNTFKVLCEQYQPSIKRDPSYPDYLNKIGHIFFGIPLPRAQPQGLFGNILQSFFSGLDEESDTESEQGPQPSTSSRQHQRHAQQSSHMETEELD
uniref:Uncharacterized protein n=1 Tax=Timema genevievae TaxID=629358 RepID=A0A7R9K6X5_TIMGE|nr:unnamed protein product [Timema genevievae]